MTRTQRALSYGGLGSVAMRRLHAIAARAHAYLGDVASARRAIRLAEPNGESRRDELHDDVAGEFGFPPERLAMSNSTTALIISDAGQAEAEARHALSLLGHPVHGDGPAHIRAGASADLAHARLLADDVDGAAAALAPVWEMPVDQRSTGIVVRTARIGRYLARPVYHGSQLPRELRERIEDFTRVSPPFRLGPPVALLTIEC